jgi:hypothetical protein
MWDVTSLCSIRAHQKKKRYSTPACTHAHVHIHTHTHTHTHTQTHVRARSLSFSHSLSLSLSLVFSLSLSLSPLSLCLFLSLTHTNKQTYKHTHTHTHAHAHIHCNEPPKNVYVVRLSLKIVCTCLEYTHLLPYVGLYNGQPTQGVRQSQNPVYTHLKNTLLCNTSVSIAAVTNHPYNARGPKKSYIHA